MKSAKRLGTSSNPELQKKKDEALMILMDTIKGELEARLKDGSLTKEFKSMRLSQVMFHLQKIAEVIKPPSGPLVNLNLPAPIPAQRLHHTSATRLSDEDRAAIDARMSRKLLKGEVVKEPKKDA